MKVIRRILRGRCTCSCGMFSRYGCINGRHCHDKAAGCHM